MKTKLLLCLALVLSGLLFGCSSAPPRSEFGINKMNGFRYQTRPVRLESEGRGLFYWFVSDDLKSIYYEPCIGHYSINTLKDTRSELFFTITGCSGLPIDLRNGNYLAKPGLVGKKFRAKHQGYEIVKITEIK